MRSTSEPFSCQALTSHPSGGRSVFQPSVSNADRAVSASSGRTRKSTSCSLRGPPRAHAESPPPRTKGISACWRTPTASFMAGSAPRRWAPASSDRFRFARSRDMGSRGADRSSRGRPCVGRGQRARRARLRGAPRRGGRRPARGRPDDERRAGAGGRACGGVTGLQSIVHCDLRVVLLHYAPVVDTLEGEPLGIYTYLGCDRLATPIAENGADLVLHGHAHAGSFEGRIGEIAVYNVAVHVTGRSFWIFELDGSGVRRGGDVVEVREPPQEIG